MSWFKPGNQSLGWESELLVCRVYLKHEIISVNTWRKSQQKDMRTSTSKSTNKNAPRRTTLQDLQADTERLQTEQLGTPVLSYDFAITDKNTVGMPGVRRDTVFTVWRGETGINWEGSDKKTRRRQAAALKNSLKAGDIRVTVGWVPTLILDAHDLMCRILWLNWYNVENCFFLQLPNCNLCSFHSEDSSKMCPRETELSQQCCFSIDQMISRWYDVLWRNKTRIDNRNECQNCRVILMKPVEWKMKLSPWKNNKVFIWIYQSHTHSTHTHTLWTTSG